jgi:diguanylate cyclase (GGDEF)-like protein/PAS domain S-box-containing protein
MFGGRNKGTIEANERRTVYADALNKSLEIFISFTEKAFDDVMSNGLRPVADAAGLDRVIVFRVFGIESNTAGEIYRWDKIEGGTAPLDNALKVLPVTSTMKRWISVVSNDTCISLRRSEFAEDEAAFLTPRGVKSILIAPVFIEREFWGVVTFHDNTNERDFDEDCTGLLRSTARLCAATIIREDKTRGVDRAIEALKRREKITDTLNRAAVTFLSQSGETFEDTMAAGVSLIASMANFDQLVLYRNHMTFSGLHMSQIYRWDRSSGGSSELIESYIDIPYARLILNWETHLANGNTVNSPAKLLSETEAAILHSFGIVSVAVIPVFINNTFWGFALFGDVCNERYFEEDIIEMMRSSAFLFANAFIRTEMEREITEETNLNRVLFATVPVGLTLYDENLRLIDCNKVVLDMCGVTKEYYLEHFLDFSPEYQNDGRKTIDKLVDIMWRALNGEKLVCEWMHKTLAGEPIPCELVLTRAKHNGKHIGLGYVYDLRNMKKMQQAVAEAEDRTRAVTEASPVSYILIDENLSPVDCNSEALRLFECPNKQYFLDHYRERFMPESQPDGQKSLEKAKELSKRSIDGEHNVFEWHYQTFSGELFPAEISLTQLIYRNKKYAIAFIYDLRNIREMEKNIQWLETEVDKIYYDGLTGIHNRRYFDENLKRIMKSLSRSGGALSLMMIDIDFFKNYNDTYGHSEGDKCLKAVAKVLSNSITRTDDFVARYGGEEFVIVLPNVGENGVRMLAARLLEKMRKRNLPHENSSVADCVTISIGAMTGKVDHHHREEDYIRCADEALYTSKQDGRNRYTFKSF